TFVERTTGVQDTFAIPGVPLGFGSAFWRPGHDEVWLPANDYQHDSTWIKTPGGPAVEVAASMYGYGFNGGQGSSVFTLDGASWFSSRSPPGAVAPIIQVGSADDPTGDRFDLIPVGTQSDSYWRLADGRILAPAWVRDRNRSDLYAVDPTTGASSVLGQ